MTRAEIEKLLNALYFKADYDLMFKRAENEPEVFYLLWDIINEKPQSESWRLMWILDHATEKKNDLIIPILNDLYELLLTSKNESFIRHAMKLILRCPINEDYAGELLDRCIEWMNNPKAKVSSQALGLEFFYQTTVIYPEMAPELLAHIDDALNRSPSKGYAHRLKKIRSEFNK